MPLPVLGGLGLATGTALVGLCTFSIVRGHQIRFEVAELTGAERYDQIKRGYAYNTVAYVSGAAGAILLMVGATALLVNRRQKKRAVSAIRLLPVAGPGHAGFSFAGRF